ncbi:MAG: hypothetical protein JWM08_2866 [Candidatus Angelobacter sp.]|nr:hypothetical protein [Candidatus Angelobacter sp.]
MFLAARLPFVWAVKLSAVLVLFEVSAESVVVALNAVPAQATTDDKTT